MYECSHECSRCDTGQETNKHLRHVTPTHREAAKQRCTTVSHHRSTLTRQSEAAIQFPQHLDDVHRHVPARCRTRRVSRHFDHAPSFTRRTLQK